MNKEERVENIKMKLLENWKKDNKYLGVKRYKLYRYCPQEERLYLWNRAIAELRKKKIVVIDKHYYCINLEKLAKC